MKIKSLLLRLFAFSLVVLWSVSCSKDGTGTGSSGGNVDCNAVTAKTFSTDVNPIIQSSCNKSGCHDVASINGPGPLTNYTQISNAKLAIREAVRTGSMPQGSSLSTSQKNSIMCWVDAGALNN